MSSDKSVPGQIRTMADDIKKARLMRGEGGDKLGIERGPAADRPPAWQMGGMGPSTSLGANTPRSSEEGQTARKEWGGREVEKEVPSPATPQKPAGRPLSFWAKNLPFGHAQDEQSKPLGSLYDKKTPTTAVPSVLKLQQQEKKQLPYRTTQDLEKLLPVESIPPRQTLGERGSSVLSSVLGDESRSQTRPEHLAVPLSRPKLEEKPFAPQVPLRHQSPLASPPPPPNLPGASMEGEIALKKQWQFTSGTPSSVPDKQPAFHHTDSEYEEEPRETPEDILGITGTGRDTEKEDAPTTVPRFPSGLPEQEEEIIRPREEPAPLYSPLPSASEGQQAGLAPSELPQTKWQEAKGPAQGDIIDLKHKKSLPRVVKFSALTASALVGAFVLGFVYWGLFVKNAPPETAPARENIPEEAKTVMPLPLFAVDSEIALRIETGEDKTSFLARVRALENSPQDPETLVSISIYDEGKGNFVGIANFLDYLSLRMPTNVLQSLSGTMMLYLYTPADEEQKRCLTSGTPDTSCSSPRLGIVFQVKPGVAQEIENALASWEKTLVGDFSPLILDSPKFPEKVVFDSATYTGKDIAYKTTLPVRFVNLPISTVSLNYSVANGYLVLATSKNSLYEALDRVVQAYDPTNVASR